LADNYVKPDDSHGTKLKALEAQVKSLKMAHKNLQSRYDALRVESQKERNKEQGKNWKGSPAPGTG
jgi:hypothetical protein